MVKKSSRSPLSLKRNFSITLISNLVFALCQWGMLIIIAKFGTPEKVGQYSLALALSAPIMLLMNFQLRSIQITDVDNKYRFSDFFIFRVITSIIAVSLIILLSFVIGYEYFIIEIIFLVSVTKFIESISDVTFGLFQKNERMDYVSISRILKGISSVLSFGIGMILTRNLALSILLTIISWLIILIIYDFKKVRVFSEITLTTSVPKLINIFKIALPLGIVSMLLSLNTNIPRYGVEGYLGMEKLGYFSAISYLYIAGNTVINALGQSAAPRLSKYFASNNITAFKKLLFKMNIIGLILGVLSVIFVMIFGRLFLTIVYGTSYADYNLELIYIMIAASINYLASFYGVALTATKTFKIQPFIGLTMVIGNVLLVITFIPKLGVTGAAISIVGTALIQYLLNLLILHLKLSKKNSF